MSRTLVVVPHAIELAPLVRGLVALGFEPRQASLGRLTCTLVDAMGLVLAIGGHGKAQLAVHAQHLLERLPDTTTVMCVGAAGGLTEAVARGDVVVGTSCVEHDFKRRFSRSPAPCHDPHAPTIARFRAATRDLQAGFTVHFGAIASGDEDIVDARRAREIHAETGALCVAWEGAGAARAAAFNGVPFVEVRAISDAANETAPADFHASLDVVMPHLAQVLVRWVQASAGSSR